MSKKINKTKQMISITVFIISLITAVGYSVVSSVDQQNKYNQLQQDYNRLQSSLASSKQFNHNMLKYFSNQLEILDEKSSKNSIDQTILKNKNRYLNQNIKKLRQQLVAQQIQIDLLKDQIKKSKAEQAPTPPKKQQKCDNLQF